MLRPIPKAVPARIALPPQTNCIFHGENMKTTIVHWMAKLLGLAIRIDGLPTGLLARREPLQQVLRDKPQENLSHAVSPVRPATNSQSLTSTCCLRSSRSAAAELAWFRKRRRSRTRHVGPGRDPLLAGLIFAKGAALRRPLCLQPYAVSLCVPLGGVQSFEPVRWRRLATHVG